MVSPSMFLANVSVRLRDFMTIQFQIFFKLLPYQIHSYTPKPRQYLIFINFTVDGKYIINGEMYVYLLTRFTYHSDSAFRGVQDVFTTSSFRAKLNAEFIKPKLKPNLLNLFSEPSPLCSRTQGQLLQVPLFF